LVAHNLLNKGKKNKGEALNGITVNKIWCSPNVNMSKDMEEEIAQRVREGILFKKINILTAFNLYTYR